NAEIVPHRYVACWGVEKSVRHKSLMHSCLAFESLCRSWNRSCGPGGAGGATQRPHQILAPSLSTPNHMRVLAPLDIMRRSLGRHGAVLSLFALASGAPNTAKAQSGLVAAYGFDETSGSGTSDLSGNANNGTLGSGVTRTTAGKFGGALVFNNGYVTVPH